ncbi:DUF2835 domain-containing protein [Marinomonas piezotolerans]|uniref:DUF2835 domain-containing protein n=1 Tax=Marinomonas piezotolerans TaxID=2213058 RepID=A0A370U5V0_9GAMM|nr:DUF2835 domain-containing protein [Marinomonas piezotolerans]RDL43152.1 DUF2835 domain-containing protein [Marinomonas piezotolerans]
MAKIIIDVDLSAHQYKEMYRGTKKYLVAQSRDGRKVQLPLSVFQRFVTLKGVYGVFEIEFDENRKLVGIEKKH